MSEGRGGVREGKRGVAGRKGTSDGRHLEEDVCRGG